MGLLLPLLLAGLTVGTVYFLAQHLLLRRRLKSVNQPRSFPILGHALISRPDPVGFMNQLMGMGYLYPNDPRMVVFWIGPIPLLMIYSCKLVDKIFSTSKHLNKGLAYTFLIPWLGHSILVSPVERWRPKRKVITPTFHYDILKDFMPIFNANARKLCLKLNNLEKPEVEILSTMSLCTLDVICETSMGRSLNLQDGENSKYLWAVHTINDLVHERTKNPLLWSDFIFYRFGKGRLHDECLEILHGFTRNVISERLEALELQGGLHQGGRRAFLDHLLESANKGEFPMEDIQEEVDTFMFEGHDTTSTALAWTTHMIGLHPHVQSRIQKEVADLVESIGCITNLEPEMLGRLPYLDCCIKESIRLRPSVPVITRELGEEQDFGGTTFPKGMTVIVNQYLIHRDPAQWKDPEVFDPDRFLPENSVGRHPFAFVPFSAGSRNCIGQRFAMMEMKVILAHLFHYFNVVSRDAAYAVRPKVELILRPVDGLHVSVFNRNPIV